ncbi:MAG: prevent-host-death protein [Ignavibacteria bacterium]
MPVIKRISDLRTKPTQIARLARASNEPIFLTRKGKGDLVVMSLEHYTSMQRRITLYTALQESEQSRAHGDKGRTLSQVTRDIRERLRAKTNI